MSITSMLWRSGPSGYGYGTTAEEVTEGLDLTGKVYVLTGCNSGIGLETLRVLSLRGAHVIAVARTKEKASGALRSVSAKGTAIACDLSEPESVVASTNAINDLGKSIDGLICNAGIMALPRLIVKSGYEMQFLTNHIGHFIFVTKLLECLADNGRVVMLSSGSHKAAPDEGIQFENLGGEEGYHPWKNYGQSKLANLLFAKSLAIRLAEKGRGQTANALHPGVIKTGLVRHMNPAVTFGMNTIGHLFLKTIPQGAATTCYVATNATLSQTTGLYFSHCNEKSPSELAQDAVLAEKLWACSEEIVSQVC